MSIHLVFLYRCRDGIAHDEFVRHWAEVHAPLVRAMPSIRGYVRDIVSPGVGPRAAWHGAEELWVDDEEAADALMRDPRFLGGPLADESLFVDTEAIVRLRTRDHAVVAGEAIAEAASLPKRMTFLKRKPDMSRAELLSYWRDVHGPLAGSVPGVRRYVQSPVVASEFSDGEPRFDGMAQVWLNDSQALQEALASPLFREQVKSDAANFVATELTVTLAVQECREI
jgi:uncharacterized protein (TIGR02118 family)